MTTELTHTTEPDVDPTAILGMTFAEADAAIRKQRASEKAKAGTVTYSELIGLAYIGVDLYQLGWLEEQDETEQGSIRDYQRTVWAKCFWGLWRQIEHGVVIGPDGNEFPLRGRFGRSSSSTISRCSRGRSPTRNAELRRDGL